MQINEYIRQLAKSQHWQTVYSASQKCSGVHLFKNSIDFSSFQMQFLYWLSVYDMLYTNLSTFEDPLLTDAVIDDDVRTDAYLYYRKKRNQSEWKKHHQEQRLQNSRSRKQRRSNGEETLIDVDLRSE